MKRLLKKFRSILKLFTKLKSFPKIIKYRPNGNIKVCHISAFSYKNAGDAILPVVLRDLFNFKIGVKNWKNIHVHTIVDDRIISKINNSDALVIGGGGLFLKDTNKNNLSGWQWPCSIEQLKKIQVPIIMFAVGYNRFRNQEEFEPVFNKHINEFVNKAKFIGIRNTGSINKLYEYLDTDECKAKLTFQPCMTTLISKIYPNINNYNVKEDFIAINCAFDREEMRYSNDSILHSISKVVKKLSEITKIKYYVHMESDKKILSFFNDDNIEYETILLKNPMQIILEYSKPRLVIGMRGHAQLIPFGCKTPILSIISHDKMQWFLNDISNPDWGVDVNDMEFENKLLTKAIKHYNNYTEYLNEISVQQDKLWDITQNNMTQIKIQL